MQINPLLTFLIIASLISLGRLVEAEVPASITLPATISLTSETERATPNTVDCENPPANNLEVCKYRLEHKKYLLEVTKRQDERTAADRKHEDDNTAMYATVLAVLVSALVGFGTIIFNLVTANRQSRLQAKLKALEVVISAAGPQSGKERLGVVSQILGKDWIPESQQKDLTIKGVGVGHDESRRTLLKLLAEYPDKRKEILADWEAVFGDGSLRKHISALKDLRSSDASSPITAVDPDSG